MLETIDSQPGQSTAPGYARASGGEGQIRQLPTPELAPRLRRLLEVHYRNRWRTSTAALLDVILCILLAFGATVSIGTRLGITPADDAFGFLFLLGWLLIYLVVVRGGLRLHGTTPGMYLLGIVAISPRTGHRAAPNELRPPTKWDYKRDRLPELLFVPRDELELRE
jgi:hypothetical protein